MAYSKYFTELTTGRTWHVSVVEKQKGKVIEFVDMKHEQFVSSYYVDTFMEIERGLDLHGGYPEWLLTDETVQEIQEWIGTL